MTSASTLLVTPLVLLLACGRCSSGANNPIQDGGENCPSLPTCEALGFACGETQCVTGEVDSSACIPHIFDATRPAAAPTQPNGTSVAPSLTADGRYLLFESRASNLVTEDTNGRIDLFLRDLEDNNTRRIETDESTLGALRARISGNGEFIVFLQGPTDEEEVAETVRYRIADGTTVVVSAAIDGGADGDSWPCAIDPSGELVVFTSDATNLVENDYNGRSDVFVRDLDSGVTVRVSTSVEGEEGDGGSGSSCSISANGNFVAFGSSATNLVDDDTNEVADIFVKNLSEGSIQRVSVAWDGAEANADSWNSSLSGDGDLVAFASVATNLAPGDTNEASDIFVYDVSEGTTTRVSVGSGGEEATGGVGSFGSDSWDPIISADGTTVVFRSWARSLSPKPNGGLEVFSHDLATGVTAQVSVSPSGDSDDDMSEYASLVYTPALGISADGRRIAFASIGGNLVTEDRNSAFDVFVRDLVKKETLRASVADGSLGKDPLQPDGHSYSGVLGSSVVAFASSASNLSGNDKNATADIFIRDLGAGSLRRIASTPNEGTGIAVPVDLVMTADGKFLAWGFDPVLDGRNDIFLFDVDAEEMLRLTETIDDARENHFSSSSAISSDGRYGVFASSASNLVAGDSNDRSDVFVRDTLEGTTVRISYGWDGSEADGSSSWVSISGDGRRIAFSSTATNLVPDGGPKRGVYLLNREDSSVTRIDVAPDGSPASGESSVPTLSTDGETVAFVSSATNLTDNDDDAGFDIFLRDNSSGSVTKVELGNVAALSPIPYRPTLSADGTRLAFASDAGDLVAGDTNEEWDIFVYDVASAEIRRVSVGNDETEGNDASFDPSLSPDGHLVAFTTTATTLVSDIELTVGRVLVAPVCP